MKCENCDDLVCENGGVCRKYSDGKSHCDCPNGYEGTKCEDSLCEGFCSGNGKCLIRLGSAQCECAEGKLIVGSFIFFLNYFLIQKVTGANNANRIRVPIIA